MPPSSSSPRLTAEGLLAEYHTYGRTSNGWLAGVELERHILDANGRPAPYFGRHGILDLLQDLIAQGGWTPYREGPFPIALHGPLGAVTLEPGGQVELSGKPYHTVAEVHADAVAFNERLDAWLEPTPYRQSALGFTPAARIDDVGWVPKGRYVIMRRHMALSGPLGHHMMKGTAATQASYDFLDELDCARKVRLGIALAPLVTAMFANSPYTHGRANGWASFRGFIWTRTDPARTGLPDAAADFSFKRWVDYLLDAPMMFTKVHGQWRAAEGRSFRTWMRDGIDGVQPTSKDWDLHQTSVFPEVRVKRQIEVRMADCVPTPLATAFVALFKGLYYSPQSLDAGEAIARRFQRYGTREARFLTACRHGLHGVVGGRRLSAWSEEVVTAAADGLDRIAPGEARFLAPLIRLVERGDSPAHLLLASLGPAPTMARLRQTTHPAHDPTVT
jgi:glutamate--cysteine ligase